MLQRWRQPDPAVVQVICVGQLVLAVAHRWGQPCLQRQVVRCAVCIHDQVAEFGGLGGVIELSTGADRREQVVRAAFELALVSDLVQVLEEALRLLQLGLAVGDVLARVE